MSKRIVTLKDKYKSTKSIYPNIISENIPNGAISENKLSDAVKVKLNNGGGKFITINAIEGATSGTFTEDELNDIRGNKHNILILDDELYSLQDDKDESGYLIFTHVGRDNTNYYVKCITITLNTRGWVLTSQQVGGGGEEKKYKHLIHLTKQNVLDVYINLDSSRENPYGTIGQIVDEIRNQGYTFKNSKYLYMLNATGIYWVSSTNKNYQITGVSTYANNNSINFATFITDNKFIGASQYVFDTTEQFSDDIIE